MMPSPTVVNRCKLILPWLALGTYWPMIFIATHIPAARIPNLQIFGRDVTLHFSGYFILTLLFWLARYRYLRPNWLTKTPYIIVGIIAVYAAADEILQTFVGRQADVVDWLADMAGCLAAMAILTLLRRCWHWLVAYWFVLFVITHWPVRDSAFLILSDFWQQFQFCYMFVAYLILTLLFWRSICPQPKFMISGKIIAATFIVIPLYALIDESLSYLLGHDFDSGDLLAAGCGLVIAFLCATAFSQHHISEQDYGE